MKKMIPFFVMFLIGLSSPADSAQPIDELKMPINKILDILHDPQYKSDDQKAVQLEKLKNVANNIFDFVEISRRSLGRNWKAFSKQERKDFTNVFAELLRNIYFKKIQSKFKNDKVAFLSQDMIKTNRAFVKTKIMRESVEIPIGYSMRLKKDNWKVYDIKVEGISLVKNYRTQFNKILLNKTPTYLIDLVKKKVERNKSR